MVDQQLGEALLVRARNAIASELGGAQVREPEHPALHQPGATFVTLTRQGEPRGCIGSIEAFRPLDQDVRENARAAAFRDRRFAPLCVTVLVRCPGSEPRGRNRRYLIATTTMSTGLPPVFLASCGMPRPMNETSPRTQLVLAGLPSIASDMGASPSGITT